MQPFLQRQFVQVIPGSNIRELVLGEIFRKDLEIAHPDGAIYAHSLASLYAASNLAQGRPSSVHFFPCSPRILYKGDSAKFIRVGKRNLEKSLRSLSRVKPMIRSLVVVGGKNADMVRWWDSWGDFKGQKSLTVKNVWSVNTRILEKKLSVNGDPARYKLPASLVVDCERMAEAPILQVTSTLSRVHPQLKVFAIVDTERQIENIKDIFAGFPDVVLELVDRRTYSRFRRYTYLGLGLTRQFFKISQLKKELPATLPVKRERKIDKPVAAKDILTTAADPSQNIEVLDPIEPKQRLLQRNPRNILKQISQFKENAAEYFEGSPIDVVISFDVISAPTGHSLALSNGARHIIDFNETPKFEDRVGRVFKSLSALEMSQLYTVCKLASTTCETGISPSTLLGENASTIFGPKVTPIRSFHGKHEFPEILGPREEFEIGTDQILLVHCCTYAKEYMSSKLLDVMALLPNHYNLIMVGSANNEDYAFAFKAMVRKLNLESRVHFKPSIDGISKYLSYMSKGDLGLIVLDNKIATVRDGLANRFVDLIGAGLPIISTHAHESTKIIEEWSIGRVVHTLNPKDIADAVTYFIDRELKNPKLPLRLSKIRETLSWDEEVKRFGEIVGHSKNKTACFVFQRGLRNNRRILRLANELGMKGWIVYCISGTRPLDFVIKNYPKITFIRAPANRPWRAGEIETEKAYYADAKDLEIWLSEKNNSTKTDIASTPLAINR